MSELIQSENLPEIIEAKRRVAPLYKRMGQKIPIQEREYLEGLRRRMHPELYPETAE